MMRLASATATVDVGRTLSKLLRVGDVVALEGTLGAGKTTLARGILAGLGLEGEVASPTFPIAIEYRPPDVALGILHVDLYRIETPDELDELGLDEARDHAALLVEWPERMGARLWPDALRLAIAADGDGRCLTWTVPAAWEGRWPPPQ